MKVRIILLITLLMITGCAQQKVENALPPSTEPVQQQTDTKVEYAKITPDEAKERMGKEGVIVLDVRTPAEYAEGHIEGAVLLPVDQIQEQAVTALPDKSAEILVYCRSGNRSKIASKALIEMGYTKVFDFGGIIDWPYETIK